MRYQIIDTHTNRVVGVYTNRIRAYRKADRLDSEYGAIRYAVKVEEKR
jgi:hypothetical protein